MMRSLALIGVAVLLAGATHAEFFVIGAKASESDYPFYGC
jgi:hypothetical protein